jgi:hypothetical protein
MDIGDIWKNAYSENSSRKAWGAKYVARHPNLVALDLSSFKCGHDAPMYSMIEEVVESSGTPYFTFHDIDENKPAGAIKIRVETIAYFLGRYQDDLRDKANKEARIREAVRAYEEALRRGETPAPLQLEPEKRPVIVPLGISLNSSMRGRGCDSGSCGTGHDHDHDHDDEGDVCGTEGCGSGCSCGSGGSCGTASPFRLDIAEDLMLPVLSVPVGGSPGRGRERERLALPVLN